MIRILWQRTICFHFGDLRQLPQVRPHPAQFVQHTLVKLCLLLAAVTKQLHVGVIKASPVLCERLRTVTLYLPEEVQRTAVDQLALLQAAPWVLLFPAAQHKLLIGFIALSPIVMGGSFKHS